MVKNLAKCIGAYKKDTILAPLFVALEVIADVLIPLLMADIIDDGITGGDMNAIIKIGIILAVVCIFSLLTGLLSGHFSASSSAGLAKNLRKKMYDKIQDFTFEKIDKYSTSGLVTRLTTDVANVQNAFQMIIRVLIRAPMMIVFSVVMVFSINTKLALIFVAIIPVLSIGLMMIMAKTAPLFEKVFKLYDKLNNLLQENIRGIRVVKSYVREEYETEKFKGTTDEIYRNFVRAEKILALNNPLMQFCMYVCTLLICWLGAQMIISETFTTGQLMSLLSYATQILLSLMVLSMVFVTITMSRASAQRISEILSESGDMQNGAVSKMTDGSVCFRDVSFGYRGKSGEQSLRHINIDISAGQTVGIIGGTGSGKSTLTQLIPRLYDVTSGKIEVGGVDIREYELEALRGQVAMVLQKNALFSGAIKDNLRWGKRDATDEEIKSACAISQAEEFINTLPDGYDTWIEQGGSNLSGGQKQRLCIARAILKEPKILILDDSTSAVDTKTDALIQNAFQNELSDTTKIIIAQRISSVQNADQIIVMDNGSVSATGTHEDLLESSTIYREVFLSQQKGGVNHGVAQGEKQAL